MFKLKPAIYIFFQFLSATLFVVNYPAEANAQTEGRRLRTIVEERYPDSNLYIGSASHHHLLTTPTANILAAEFSYVTPANKFKQSYIHPEPGTWQWQHCDDWVAFAAKNNQVMRLHAPISPQSSPWVKDDQRTASELKQMLEEYMSAVCKRFNDVGHIKWLDVVNETLNSDGTWFGPKEGTDTWENPWPKIGFDNDPNQTPLYIKYAFEIADSLAPDLKLIINQHGSMEKVLWDKIKETVLYLRNMGLRVDGIGWQAHVDAGWEKEDDNLAKLKALIEWAHANNLEFHVTENNAWLYSWEWDSAEEREKNFVKQGETFAAIVRTLLPYRQTGVVTWNLWHIQDDEAQGYKWGKSGCLWTTEGEPKSGYYQVQRILEIGTDSVRYALNLNVTDLETGEELKDYQLTFNEKEFYPGSNGIATATNVLAGLYPMEVKKQHYQPSIQKFYIHSDTSISIELSKNNYQVQLQTEKMDNSRLEGVFIDSDRKTYKTNDKGTATVIVPVGTYAFTFYKQGFDTLTQTHEITSDTTFTVKVRQSHGYIRFSVIDGHTPVPDAVVRLNNDSTQTNDDGIATFNLNAFNHVYNYSIYKDAYPALSDSLLLISDTTIAINYQTVTTPSLYVNSEVWLYPVPAKDVITISSENNMLYLSIKDITGSTIKHIHVNQKRCTIPVNDLKPGLYIAEIAVNHKKETVRFLIK